VFSLERLPYVLLGCCGNLTVRTPHFDRLAAASITWDACFQHFRGEDASATLPLAESVRALASSGVPVRHLHLAPDRSPVEPVCALLRDFVSTIESGLLWLDHPGLPAGASIDSPGSWIEALRAADGLLGELLDATAEGAEGVDLLIVCGLQSLPLHGGDAPPRLRDAVLHVPLFVWQAGSVERARRRQKLVTVADVGATLWARWGLLPPPSIAQGLDLLAGAEVSGVTRREALVLCGPGGARAVRTADYLCVARKADSSGVGTATSTSAPDPSPAAELFLKPDDFWDVLDVAAQHPDTVVRLLSLTLSLTGRGPDDALSSDR
jgi:hypothetical protein